ncbi:germination protein GerLB [Paenibacillus albidus]|uniref:Germination protein GerLB n=1 Tax=Paenibacillus albidus TaxID=2041023 RepID=A0A917CAL4_9BACL|nr:endospore germination permease [Paenibacillus albidus]GGF82043.1 germination protein GerLB [Paenibacillus albidus]
MNNNRPITTLQVTAVITSTIIGVGILSFPRYMADAAGSGAPLVTAAGLPVAFAGLWFTAAVCRRFPQETLFVFSRRLLGRGFADILSFCIFLFFAFSTGLTMRQFGEVCVTVIFKKTPVEAVILMMLLLAALSVRRNVIKFTYIHIFYAPFILSSIFIIVLVALKDIDGLNLLPLTGNHTTAASFFRGMVTSSTLYQGTIVLALLVPLMKNPRKVLKAGTAALLIVGIVYILIVLITVGMFGAYETRLLLYPTLETARSISIGEGVLERFDAIFIIVWVISIFTTIFTNYYLAAYALREATRFRDQRLLASFLLPFIFTASLLPKNVFQSYCLASVTAIVGLILLTLYPLLLWLTAILRNQGGASS